jgi:hypothetical protein
MADKSKTYLTSYQKSKYNIQSFSDDWNSSSIEAFKNSKHKYESASFNSFKTFKKEGDRYPKHSIIFNICVDINDDDGVDVTIWYQDINEFLIEISFDNYYIHYNKRDYFQVSNLKIAKILVKKILSLYLCDSRYEIEI